MESLVIAPYTADDDLIAEARRTGRPQLRVARPAAPAVVLGRGGRPEVELDLAACRAAGAPLLRRPGGGCAVLLDPGDVVVSLVHRAPGFADSRARFARISRWLLEALAGLGLDSARADGGSDLVIGDRKFAGASMQRSGGLLYYSASILVSPDLDLMERCLRHPPREPAYRAGRRHRDFVRPLGLHPGGWTAPALEDALRRALDPGPFA